MKDEINNAVETYGQRMSVYQSCARRTEALLIDLLKTEQIKFHFTESRAKTVESLRDKLSRPGKSYDDPLRSVPDLVGIRIVLYYQDDVARVGTILEREFDVLEKELAHQQEGYSPDQFGYLSVHYVICIGDPRSQLAEWQEAAGIKMEVQIRTVLQHAWAAVSHVLQYKREGDVPVQLRRKLFRLAGLFELADEQFVAIREERTAVVKRSQEAVRDNQPGLQVDAPVLMEFINSSKRFKAIRARMAKTKHLSFTEDEFEGSFPDYEYVGELVETLERLEITTVDELSEMLTKDYTEFIAAIDHDPWLMSEPFALYLLVIAANPDSFSADNLIEHGFNEKLATGLINIVAKLDPA